MTATSTWFYMCGNGFFDKKENTFLPFVFSFSLMVPVIARKKKRIEKKSKNASLVFIVFVGGVFWFAFLSTKCFAILLVLLENEHICISLTNSMNCVLCSEDKNSRVFQLKKRGGTASEELSPSQPYKKI
eukprot:TRINITY_DN4187_c3_g1_i1.p1 TRINITY_DN4187_c3_g1~~TRINITY_DN4187_c3_g1_i1.p1  ORF type:complete len:130 (+),score=5.33 TRINITY_DN4187_c3_g1_i1:698-1087(+)